MQEGRGPVIHRSTGRPPVPRGHSAAASDDNLPSHAPAGLTWHGYLIQLLHIASSIEHALMVQYLYAAYSLDDERRKPEEQSSVTLWRNLILSIAKEEMGHLLTVQNVLCLLGGQMELVRENYPWDSGFYPFEFRLEPLTVGSLACYLYAEMGDEPALGSKLLNKLYVKLVKKHLENRARQDRARARELGHTDRFEETHKSFEELSQQNVHKVGVLYKRMIQILSDADRIPDAVLQGSSVRFQASADEWGRGYGIATLADLSFPPTKKKTSDKFNECIRVLTEEPTHQRHQLVNRMYRFRDRYSKLTKPEQQAIADNLTRADVMIERVATRQQAVDALSHIAAQGEGHLFKLLSHFGRFSLIMEDFQNFRKEERNKGKRKQRRKANKKEKKEWEPWTHAVVTDPRTSWQDEPAAAAKNEPTRASIITHPLSEKWANLFNLRYRMLLTYLSHAFQLARDSSEARVRGAIIHKVFAEMYNLKAIAGFLVRLPLTERKKDKSRAGPPFQMPYTLAIPMDPMDRWRLHRDLLTGAEELNKQIRSGIDKLKRNRSPPLTSEFLSSSEESLRAMQELDEQSVGWIGKVIDGLPGREVPTP
jgi:Ferritin-like